MSEPSRYQAWVHVLTGTLVLWLAMPQASLQAAPRNHMIVVSKLEGKGLDRCLARDDQVCGKASADALCRAHGLQSARSFGLADDVTGTVMDRTSPRLRPGALVVDCGH